MDVDFSYTLHSLDDPAGQNLERSAVNPKSNAFLTNTESIIVGPAAETPSSVGMPMIIVSPPTNRAPSRLCFAFSKVNSVDASNRAARAKGGSRSLRWLGALAPFHRPMVGG